MKALEALILLFIFLICSRLFCIGIISIRINMGGVLVNPYQLSFNKYVHPDSCQEDSPLNPYLQLDGVYYMEKSSAFYLEEHRLFRLLMLHDTGFQEQSALSLHFYVVSGWHFGLLSTFEIKDTVVNAGNKRAHSTLSFLDATFDLRQILAEHGHRLQDVKIYVYVENKLTKSMTKEPMELRIKSMKRGVHNSKPPRMLHCSKCLLLEDKDYTRTKWWLELLKHSGYTNVHLCNQSIPNTNKFRELFTAHGDFVRVSPMRCMPNMRENDAQVFSSFSDLYQNFKRLLYSSEGLVDLDLYQCYMENIDKYDYISVFDIDEMVIPPARESLLSSNYEFPPF